MLKPITYEEYHKIYSDHLMRDVDNVSNIRIIECEYFDMDHRWYLVTNYPSFSLMDLDNDKPIRMITIS